MGVATRPNASGAVAQSQKLGRSLAPPEMKVSLDFVHALAAARETFTFSRQEMTAPESYLKKLDYSVVQQCMHCGLCLPTCPTYDATKMERNSPRGRIALMRAIADGKMEATRTFAEEMYFCL